MRIFSLLFSLHVVAEGGEEGPDGDHAALVLVLVVVVVLVLVQVVLVVVVALS